MQRKAKRIWSGGGGVTLFLAGLLTVGMAGCGGDEPTPIARPVTPPPAPPAFQPQPVEITLGTSGDTVTLMTTESGGFTLNGEPFASGGNVTAGTGGQYTLMLAEGTWTAQFDAHEIMIPLGMSEETVTITQAEDGSYWLGEMAVRSGETVHTAANGNEYVLRITTDESGAVTWMADYRMPMIAVMLGLSGDTVTLERREDGSYWLDEMAVTSGETTAHAGNGNTYTLTLGEDGMWMAEYMEMVVEVMLGTSGETVTVSKSEDGGYWLGEMQVEDGVTVATASNGNRYRLRMDTEGMWMAEYVPLTGTVTVGTLGVTLETVQAEDGSKNPAQATINEDALRAATRASHARRAASVVTGEGGITPRGEDISRAYTQAQRIQFKSDADFRRFVETNEIPEELFKEAIIRNLTPEQHNLYMRKRILPEGMTESDLKISRTGELDLPGRTAPEDPLPEAPGVTKTTTPEPMGPPRPEGNLIAPEQASAQKRLARDMAGEMLETIYSTPQAQQIMGQEGYDKVMDLILSGNSLSNAMEQAGFGQVWKNKRQYLVQQHLAAVEAKAKAKAIDSIRKGLSASGRR